MNGGEQWQKISNAVYSCVNGVVTKKQFAVTTVDYYCFAAKIRQENNKNNL